MSIPSPTSVTAPSSVGRRVALGAASVAAGAMAGKTVGVFVQIALGWLLAPEDFAIYASALGLNLVTASLIDGGTGRFLLRSGEDYLRLVRPARKLAAIANVISGMIVLWIAAWSWWYWADGRLAAVLAIMAGQTILVTPVSMARIRLQHAMRFAAVARIEVISVVIRGLMSVGLAALGFGPMAFVLPLLINLPIEWMLLSRAAGGALPDAPAAGESVRSVLRSTRWIVASNTAQTLAGRGDYLALTLAAPSILASYFFGFQLAAASVQLFMSSLRLVLLPGLSWVGDDLTRLRTVARRAVGVANLVFPFACGGLLLLSPTVVDAVWAGRWNDSIVVIQAVALSTAMRAGTPVAFALMEARSKWIRVAVINAANGASLIAVVLLTVAWFGSNLTAVVVGVALQRVVMGFVVQGVALRMIGVGGLAILRWVASGPLAMASGLTVVLLVVDLPDAERTGVTDGLAALALFLVGWSAFVLLFERRHLADAVMLLRRRRDDQSVRPEADGETERSAFPPDPRESRLDSDASDR